VGRGTAQPGWRLHDDAEAEAYSAGRVEMRSTAFAQTRKSCLGRSAIAVARRGGGHEGLCWDFYTQKAKVDTESVKTP